MPPPPRNKAPMNVVEIESSDDEQDVNGGQNTNFKSSNEPQSQVSALRTVSTSTNPPPGSESRSFWKAGAYDIGPIKWTPAIGELEHARVHPKFLHSNATSHKWAFGAIAELLDNAVDEICNGATFVMVDRIFSKRDNSPALLFQDDGGGMNPEGIRKCMSLGYSSKKTNSTIGQYGNGFKTSTMRLGADVIVFTRACSKSQITQSVGLLSYTFLRRTGQDDVIVPMIDFNVSDHRAEPIIYGSHDDWSTNLKTILEWSPFESKDDLMQQFQDIGPHGTKIIVYNLWLNDEGIYELNFDEDDEDIRLRDEANRGGVSKLNKKVLELQSHISYRIRYSLRDYASMLYLRKFENFKILLRGKPVEQFNIADELKYKESVSYRPQVTAISKEVVAETTLGFIKEAPSLGVCGYNVYHKNRLIRPFWKVTGDGNSKGHGVVGVLEANFVEPAHDKQDFERSSVFTRLEMRLKQMLMEYWKSHCHLIGHNPDPGFLRKMQKEGAPPQPNTGLAGANAQMHRATGGNIVGLSAIPQKEMHVNQPIVGLVANPRQDLGGALPQGKTGYGPSVAGQPSVSGFDQAVACVDGSKASSIDQICDENIQLFMRCEEHIQKQSELRSTIQELEKQVAETKRKCAELSSHIETQKRKLLPQQESRA